MIKRLKSSGNSLRTPGMANVVVKVEEAKRKREEEESIEETKIRQKTGYYFVPNKSEEWAVEFIAKSSPVMHPKEEDR